MLRLNLKEQILFFNQMGTLVGAGIPLLKALESVSVNAPSRALQKFARTMKESIIKGSTLSEAIERLPGISDEFIINLVRVGEQVGFLDVKFKEIALFLEKILRFRTSIITHMIYPLILLHASILLPPLFYIFLGQVETYLKVTLSFLIPFYLITTFTILLYVTLNEIKPIRVIFDWFLACIPILSGISRTMAVARFTRALGCLYEAGIVLTLAVPISARACGNMAIAEQLAGITRSLDSGILLADALNKTRLFHPMAIQLLATGEDTGDLAKMLLKTTEFLDEQLEETMKRFFVILPFVIYALMGFYIGYVFITQFMKIYKSLML
jgi:type IV pilus assembly protein PilC